MDTCDPVYDANNNNYKCSVKNNNISYNFDETYLPENLGSYVLIDGKIRSSRLLKPEVSTLQIFVKGNNFDDEISADGYCYFLNNEYYSLKNRIIYHNFFIAT